MGGFGSMFFFDCCSRKRPPPPPPTHTYTHTHTHTRIENIFLFCSFSLLFSIFYYDYIFFKEIRNEINWRSYLACIVSSTASHAVFFLRIAHVFLFQCYLCDAFSKCFFYFNFCCFLKKKNET